MQKASKMTELSMKRFAEYIKMRENVGDQNMSATHSGDDEVNRYYKIMKHLLTTHEGEFLADLHKYSSDPTIKQFLEDLEKEGKTTLQQGQNRDGPEDFEEISPSKADDSPGLEDQGE